MRYVDDIFAIGKKGETDEIMRKLSEKHSAINFTMEAEKDGKLSFLDVLLIRNRQRIEADVYRKPTDAPLCIPSESHHPMSHKLSAFESALYRMWAFPLTPERRNSELEYILRMVEFKRGAILKLNEKPKKRRWCRNQTTLKPQKTDKRRKVEDRFGNILTKNIVIPYYSPLTGRLENVLRSQNINVCYQNRGNLRESIGRVKRGKEDLEKSGIY